MKRVGIFEALNMVGFIQQHVNDPDTIIAAYRNEPERWEALKASFPEYKTYVDRYSDLAKALRDAGIPL